MSEKKIEKGLAALRHALDAISDERARKALLELSDMLAMHKGAMGAIVDASVLAKKTRHVNLHKHMTDEATAALAAAKRSLTLSGIDKLVFSIADDAAVETAGADGMLQNKAANMREAAYIGAAVGLEAQMRALPIGIMASPAGERSISLLREALRHRAEAPKKSNEPRPSSGDPEYDALPDHPYEPPEMTDELAAAIARDVARIMVLGDAAVTGGTSELRDKRFAIRSAMWEHGFFTDEHSNRESFRRRLYRSGNKNQNDPALVAFEAEMARLTKDQK